MGVGGEWIALAAEAHPRCVRNAGRDMRRGTAAIEAAHHATTLIGLGDKPVRKNAARDAIDMKVRSRLEHEFTRRSDDGLLEYLVDRALRPDADERRKAVGTLASSVLDRRLFKMAARAGGPADLARAQETYERFGTPQERRRLEKEAADFAGADNGWSVVIWLPDPKTRMKAVECLAESGAGP